MPSLLWLQAGACSGDTMAILNVETPSLFEGLELYGVDLWWHPSLAVRTVHALGTPIEEVVRGDRTLDVRSMD